MLSELRSINSYNAWVVVFVAVGTIASAYGLAIIGSTVGEPGFYRYFGLAPKGTPGYDHTTNMVGALNGVNSAGAIAGSLLQAWTADAFSRKRTIQLGSVILIIGGALCSGAVHMAMFLVGRFIAGAGSGILTCIVPIYQAEVSTAETRGAMVAMTGVMYSMGYSLAGWLGYACYFTDPNSPRASFAWRFPLAAQVLFPLIVLAGSPMLPYSPRWLLQQGRREEALSVLERLHETSEDVQHVKAQQEFDLIDEQFKLDQTLSLGRRFELFRTAPNRRRALVASLLMWGDQFLGVYVMTNYGVIIYSNLGLTGSIPLLLNACWNSFTMIGNSWTAFSVDRFGRRTYLLTGTVGCIVSLIFLCALSAQYLGSDHLPGLRAAVFFMFFFIFWWSFFMDATQYVYVAEIFPNHLRPQGVALGLTVFYLASEVTLVGAPVALDRIGWKFYLVLIIPSACYLVTLYFLFPETKGKTLEEIGALFGDTNVATVTEGERMEEGKNNTAELEKSEVASPEKT